MSCRSISIEFRWELSSISQLSCTSTTTTTIAHDDVTTPKTSDAIFSTHKQVLEQVFFEGEFVADFEVVDVQRLRDETDRPREALLHRCVLKI